MTTLEKHQVQHEQESTRPLETGQGCGAFGDSPGCPEQKPRGQQQRGQARHTLAAPETAPLRSLFSPGLPPQLFLGLGAAPPWRKPSSQDKRLPSGGVIKISKGLYLLWLALLLLMKKLSPEEA